MSAFIDPLYRPYSDCRYKINTGYPLVDPYRRHLGKGNTMRSQHTGYCPPGYALSANQYCVQLEPESWGTFYRQFKPKLEYSNGKIPYNT